MANATQSRSPDERPDWSDLVEAGRWDDLLVDAVHHGIDGDVRAVAAFVEAYAPEDARPVLLMRCRRVERGEWAELISDAAAVHDVEGLRMAWRLITAGAPADRKDGLLRRVQAAAAASQKTLDREAAKATGPAHQDRGPSPRPAHQPARPAGAHPGPSPSRTPAPAETPARPTQDQPPASAARSEVAGRLEDAEDRRWRWELSKATAKANERRAEVGGTQVELTEDLVTAALDEWHAALTVESDPMKFVSTPAWTGLCLARWLCERYPVIPTPTAVPFDSVLWELPRRRGHKLMRMVSFFDPSVGVAAGDFLVEIDVNAQHLAAARGVELGDGEPTHVLDAEGTAAWVKAAWIKKAKISDPAGAVQLTPEGWLVGLNELVKRPGYVILGARPDLSGLPAHARLAFAKAGPRTILPTPLARYLVADHGVSLDVVEAIFWDTRPVFDPQRGKHVERNAYGRRLEKWATVVTDGRTRLMQHAAGHGDDHPAALAMSLLKPMYAQFTGAFLRSTDYNKDRRDGEPTGWLRPDWYDQLVARAAANMLRALDKAISHGLAAVGGLKDAVWAIVPAPVDGQAPAVPAGMEQSAQAGKWKVNRWAVVDDTILDGHARGRQVPVREALAEVHNARIREAA